MPLITNYIAQPTDDTCSQSCVAMIAGCSVQEVMERGRFMVPMEDSAILSALKTFGFQCEVTKPPRNPYEWKWPRLAILILRRRNQEPINTRSKKPRNRYVDWCHAVVLADGMIHDPSMAYAGYPIPFMHYANGYMIPASMFIKKFIWVKGRSYT